MIPFIPGMIQNRVRSVSSLDEPKREHPSKKKNDQNQKLQEELLERMKINCGMFRATCPDSWKTFEKDFRSLYNHVYNINRESPLDYCSRGIDANYWSLVQANTQGKLEVIETILGVLQIRVEMEIPIVAEVASVQKILPKKTFFKKIVDFCVIK